ncbi:hypothetical protein [Rhizobacter fulvus]
MFKNKDLRWAVKVMGELGVAHVTKWGGNWKTQFGSQTAQLTPERLNSVAHCTANLGQVTDWRSAWWEIGQPSGEAPSTVASLWQNTRVASQPYATAIPLVLLSLSQRMAMSAKV